VQDTQVDFVCVICSTINFCSRRLLGAFRKTFAQCEVFAFLTPAGRRRRRDFAMHSLRLQARVAVRKLWNIAENRINRITRV
jgi:hypothetical protein